MNRFCVIVTLCVVGLITTNSWAVDVTPSQAALLDMVDVTTVFGPSQTSTVLNIVPNGTDGVAYQVNWDDTGEGFTRVVFQKENVESDWSGFDNFTVTFTPFAEDIGVKPFIQTGANFDFFETAFTSIAVADGATDVPLDLTAVSNPDQIRQFGYQIFGPGGQGVVSSVLVSATPGAVQWIPEPSGGLLMVLAALSLLGIRR